MERKLKVIAILLTLIIVLSILTGSVWNWFIRPIFWVIYLICIVIDIWCIKRLKKIQRGKNK